MGPDTYLLQLRDVEFPCRLRSYMKVATERSPAYAMSTKEFDFDYKAIEEAESGESTAYTRKRYQPKRRSNFKPTQFVVWKDYEKEGEEHTKTFEERYHEIYGSETKKRSSRLAITDSKTALQRASMEADYATDRLVAEARATHKQARYAQAEANVTQVSHQQRQEKISVAAATGQRRSESRAVAVPEAPCPTCGNPEFRLDH
ncbi:hypothetical protein SK128_020954 [Halocaridina rubra]|uniref:Uncharacterized protein n=1 Tax=Halocaridina rubra TaxID=373956 RepID=A0AAN9AE23_HALRR